MTSIDLNADIGEAEDPAGIESELAILQYVSSVNIACGGHRGDEHSMRRMVKGALENTIQIGAHPSYPDRENFGRVSKALGQDIDENALRQSLSAQIRALIEIAASEGAQVSYVKPHGALYNDSVHSAAHAGLIASVISKFGLAFMGAPNSQMTEAARRYTLNFIPEGFIDRRYTDDGHLQSRAIDGAVIEDIQVRLNQTTNLVTRQRVKTASGQWLTICCDSLCLHGDSAGAVETARLAREAIETAGVNIKAFGDMNG